MGNAERYFEIRGAGGEGCNIPHPGRPGHPLLRGKAAAATAAGRADLEIRGPSGSASATAGRADLEIRGPSGAAAASKKRVPQAAALLSPFEGGARVFEGGGCCAAPLRRRLNTRAGLTLVELMVAMAIFVTVLSGTLLLFNGAISTVRQGYRTMEAFEKARGSMTVLERDLTGAFTARDVGQDFQFYGRPNGFTFVGNIDGSMARVTYAVNANAAQGQFRAELVERYGLLNIRAIEQEKRRGNDPSVNAPIAVALAEYLILSGQLPPTATIVPADLYLAAQAEANGEPFGTPMNINVRIPILVTTGGLVRYVERGSLLSNKRPGVTDIDTFDAPLDAGGVPVFDWPSMNTLESALASPEDSTEKYVAAYLEQGTRAIYLNGIDDTLMSLRLPTDRFALDRQLVTTLFDARKRDLWVRMVAGDSRDFGVDAIWDTPALNVEEYALTDSIVIRAIPIVEVQPYQSAFNNFDILNINNHFFDYGIVVDKDESAGVSSDDVYMSSWWNSEENIVGIGVLEQAINTGQGPARDQLLLEFNNAVVAQMEGNRVAQAGLPLRPKLPEVVQPGFWIMMENPWVGSAEFKRWFNQVIQVPAGDTRKRDELLPVI